MPLPEQERREQNCSGHRIGRRPFVRSAARPSGPPPSWRRWRMPGTRFRDFSATNGGVPLCRPGNAAFPRRGRCEAGCAKTVWQPAATGAGGRAELADTVPWWIAGGHCGISDESRNARVGEGWAGNAIKIESPSVSALEGCPNSAGTSPASSRHSHHALKSGLRILLRKGNLIC